MITDILIIGGGITARRAAKIAAERYNVLLISDGGGSSPFIHGLNVPLLPEDSSELLYEDTIKSGAYQNVPSLAKALSLGAIAVKEELSDRFDKASNGSYELLKPLGSSVKRVAGIHGRTGVVTLQELTASKRYKELASTRAISLIKKEDRIIGAKAYVRSSGKLISIYARAVLIATGGFGGIFPFSTNSRDIGGDGIAMAFMAGAELCDMEFIQYEPTVAVAPHALIGKSVITTMLFEGAVMRNRFGDRFMDEQVGKDKLSLGIAEEILRGGGTENGGIYYDMTAVPEEMLLGKYKDYFERYNRQGIDIRKTPVEIAPAPHTTMGGIRIDEYARTTVKGLFAAGEAAGGVHGANRLGGNAGLEVFVFGDIAGNSLVEFLDGDKETANGSFFPTAESEASDVPFDAVRLRESLEGICKKALGVIKNERSLTEANYTVDGIIKKAMEHKDSFEACRLFNDSLTVRLLIGAALERKESVGGHVRSDGKAHIGERYTVTLIKDNNSIKVQRRSLL